LAHQVYRRLSVQADAFGRAAASNAASGALRVVALSPANRRSVRRDRVTMGKAYRESGARRGRGRTDGAAMGVHDLARDEEPEAHIGRVACTRVFGRRLHQRIEDALQLRFRDLRPSVADVELQRVAG